MKRFLAGSGLVAALFIYSVKNSAGASDFPGIVNSDYPYFELHGHPGTIFTACFIDNQHVVSGDHLGNLILWDLETRQKIKSIEGSNTTSGIRQLQYHDGTIYGTGRNGNLVGWDACDLSEKLTIYLPLETLGFNCLPEDRVVYTRGRHGELFRVDWETSEKTPIDYSPNRFCEFLEGTHTCVVTVPTPDEKVRTIAVFDLKKQAIQRHLDIEVPHNARVDAGAHETRLALAKRMQGPVPIQIVDSRNGKKSFLNQPHNSVTFLTFSHDGNLLACSSQSGITQQKFNGSDVSSSHSVWKLSTGERLPLNCLEGNQASFTWKRGPGWGYACAFSPDDSLLVVGGMEGTLRCFQLDHKDTPSKSIADASTNEFWLSEMINYLVRRYEICLTVIVLSGLVLCYWWRRKKRS